MNKEISAVEASNLRKNNEEVLFLDVREDSELEICSIADALHIPMNSIPERCEALPLDRPLVVFCHHGMRSMNVLLYLESRGFRMSSTWVAASMHGPLKSTHQSENTNKLTALKFLLDPVSWSGKKNQCEDIMEH